ncbi:MAG TPA: YceI family protein [Candidatus Elarobacter sp.]|nr:YceI family protein [Candidatus Elarobacter sp.]
MRTLVKFITAATMLAAAPLGAQGAVRLQLAPGSQLTFTGTSTMHGFTCTTKELQAYIDVDQGYRTKDLSTLARPIVGVQVVIPVKSLSCGGDLEKNMYKTLRADQYPYITYKLSNYDLVAAQTSAAALAADTKGKLAISGAENGFAMRVEATRAEDGLITATGEQTMKMSDFGIKPPTFMLGALRVGDELKVRFTLKATSPAVASAMHGLGLADVTGITFQQQ